MSSSKLTTPTPTSSTYDIPRRLEKNLMKADGDENKEGIDTMGIETLTAQIQGYELRSGSYRVFSSFPRRTVKEELFRDLQIHGKGKKATWM
ncbi:hypothetical protein KY285_024208 [Solanum tuberosum]|nr:hypothetical protein KY289_024546 [Solanum tuberosum]KAH0673198.1 hypothetical protein KY284_024285 [Solanum tuberosum]KAH0676407.1 hypothetical protein KY285_024208 [Solanum tuberosum]